MQCIPLKFASPGMIIAKAVQKDNGMVLVGEGCALTDSVIERLDQAGISSIAVKGNPVAGFESGVDVARLRDRLDFLFRKYRNNPLMWTLRNMLGEYYSRYMADEAARMLEEQEKLQAMNSTPKSQEKSGS